MFWILSCLKVKRNSQVGELPKYKGDDDLGEWGAKVSIDIMSKNYLPVQNKSEKWGVIDISGKQIIPFEYDYLEGINEELLCFKLNEKYGIANLKNKVIAPAKFNDIDAIGKYLLKENIRNNKEWIMLDYQGKINVNKPEECNDSACIHRMPNGKFSLFSKKENRINSAEYDDIRFNSGFITRYPIYVSSDLDSKGFIAQNSRGKHLIWVTKKGKEGFLDYSGNIVIPIIYEYFSNVTFDENGYAWVQIDGGKRFLIDTNGNEYREK